MPRTVELIYDVRYPRRRGSMVALLALARPLLIIPHAIVNVLLMIPLLAVTLCAWFSILFTGHYPVELWQFSASVVARFARVGAYAALLRSDYPPFGDQPYPVRFEIAYPGRQSRLLLIARWVLLVPHLAALVMLGLTSVVLLVIAWIGMLLTGAYPRQLFEVSVGAQRWGFRVLLYALMLTDTYPHFSFGPRPAPMGTMDVPESWVLPGERAAYATWDQRAVRTEAAS